MRRVFFGSVILFCLLLLLSGNKPKNKFVVKYVNLTSILGPNKTWDTLSINTELNGTETIQVATGGAAIISDINDAASYAILCYADEPIKCEVNAFYRQFEKKNSNRLRAGVDGTYSGMGGISLDNQYYNITLDDILRNGDNKGLHIERLSTDLFSDFAVANNTGYPLFLSLFAMTDSGYVFSIPDEDMLLFYTNAGSKRIISDVNLTQFKGHQYSVYAIGCKIPFAIGLSNQQLRIIVSPDDKDIDWYYCKLSY